MNECKNILENIKFSEVIINKDILLFLYNLFKYIFIKRENQSNNSNIKGHLDKLIAKINEQIIRDKYKYIKIEYSIENFNNIINFVKIQNLKFAGDILEGILIYIFNLAFKASQDYTFGKYIFNNLYNGKNESNFDLADLFETNKFIPEELKNITKILIIDYCYESIQEKYVILNILFQIYNEKYATENIIDKSKKFAKNYLKRGFSDKHVFYYNESFSTGLDNDLIQNSNIGLIIDYFPTEFGKIKCLPIKLIRSFLIQVFIYSQNKNSPLMKYRKEKLDYAKIPFVYDLNGADVEDRFANIILAPIRIEPRINKIVLSNNNLKEFGLYEIGKAIIFNRAIKTIDFNASLLKNNYFDYLNLVLGLFDYFSVEELNLSYNKLIAISEEYLANLITHFKKLKTLNLNMNELKNGISTFFIVLKKLYRKGETKLENLFLNNCLLDDISFYELGDLLKCKYCKLKKLYLNNNIFPSDINFLKKLKKNKSLTEIYLCGVEIGNNQIDDIMRFMSNSESKYLYLYKNKNINFNQLLKLLYRTKIIKDEKEFNDKSVNIDECFLTNLDISNNNSFIKNEFHVEIIKKLINQTSLNCLDISHILYGPNPDKNILDYNNKYYKSVEILKNLLEKEKTDYIEDAKHLKSIQIDIKRLKEKKVEKPFNISDEIIMKIIENQNVKFTIVLEKQAIQLIKDNIKNNLIDENDIKNIESKLVKYMKLKKLEKEVERLEKGIKSKKLIII